MIISHKHKFIFLKTHKTAGTSLQIALSSNCGKSDIISRLHEDDLNDLIKAGGKVKQNDAVSLSRYNYKDWFQYLLRGRKQYFTEHLDEFNIMRWIGSEIWNSYYKFCFERHPYDKVLSYYYWRTRNKNISLEEFIDEELNTLSDFNIYGKGKEIKIDKVFLYEDIDSSVNFLENKFQIEIKMDKVRAKSKHRPKAQFHEEELSPLQKDKIEKAFEREFEFFYPEHQRK